VRDKKRKREREREKKKERERQGSLKRNVPSLSSSLSRKVI
jgi:hypothetical protein